MEFTHNLLYIETNFQLLKHVKWNRLHVPNWQGHALCSNLNLICSNLTLTCSILNPNCFNMTLLISTLTLTYSNLFQHDLANLQLDPTWSCLGLLQPDPGLLQHDLQSAPIITLTSPLIEWQEFSLQSSNLGKGGIGQDKPDLSMDWRIELFSVWNTFGTLGK